MTNCLIHTSTNNWIFFSLLFWSKCRARIREPPHAGRNCNRKGPNWIKRSTKNFVWEPAPRIFSSKKHNDTVTVCVSPFFFLFLFFSKDQKGIFSSISLFPPPRRPNFLFHSIANWQLFSLYFFFKPKNLFYYFFWSRNFSQPIFWCHNISLSHFYSVWGTFPPLTFSNCEISSPVCWFRMAVERRWIDDIFI